MSRSYTIDDAGGRRQVRDGDFPLVIGGPQADVSLNGFDGSEPLAYLGLDDGDLFVQPAESDSQQRTGAERLACNGTALAASHWLRDGDVLRLGPARLDVEIDDRTARFVVREVSEKERAKPVLQPPPRQAVEAGSPMRGATVQPIALEPGRASSSAGSRRGLRLGTVAAVVFIALLAAAATFVFTSRSILVSVDPPPERMAIEGGLSFELGGRHLLRPGSYRLVVEKDGFRRLEAPFEVSGDSNQSFRFELERLPGLLEIVGVNVAGAEVLIDGEAVAVLPLEGPLEVAPGEHEIRIRADRYREVVETISIEGAGVTQSFEAELAALWAPVRFSSKPPGAAVRIAGTTVGHTPVTAEVLEGRHGYELLLAGYKRHRGQLNVVAGEAAIVPTVTLAPSDGNVVLLAEPDGATVTVDGVYRGEAPLDLRLEPGRPHQVKVSKAGYEPQTREVEVRPEETRELRVTLAAVEGEVRVAGWPPDADLFVNGEPRGKASATLRLQSVPHEIEIRKAGFTPYRTTLTPMPGVAQSIEVTLEEIETDEVAEADPTSLILRTSEGHELRRVEPGRFLMGASRREPGRRANEVLREAELTRAFYLGTKEISNAQYRRFKSDHLSGHVGGRTLDIDEHPVVGITWQEAAQYCNWLSAQEGLSPAYVVEDGQLVLADPSTTGYRLPTEAEWAWAARFPDGKSSTKFPWGPSLPVAAGSGNYADASAKEILPGVIADYDDGFPGTAPVDSFEPDERGFYNLGGNVAEWTHDFYAIRPAGSSKVARDPFGPEEGDFHVIRGSSWMHSTVTELRLTFRDYADKARPDVGFRIARYVVE